MNNSTWDTLLSILTWPTTFQMPLLHWVLGLDTDAAWWMWAKRIGLLLPILAFLGACWISTISLATVVVRAKRREFSILLIKTWWELGYSFGLYWGGFFRAVVVLLVTAVQAVRILLFGVWLLIQDLILSPLYMAKGLGRSMATPGFPWIAVVLTILWVALESAVFAYVTTPLVIDTLSNVTGEALSEFMIRPPLFLFMMFLILGSYAVLVHLGDALKSRNVVTIFKICSVELVSMFVEIMFLYREFVDSLSPWIAQKMGGDFTMGMGATITIATACWLGVRSLSWFSFAGAGTPPLLAMIQGTGVRLAAPEKAEKRGNGDLQIKNFLEHLHFEMDWFRTKGEEVGGAFLIPPIQLLAVTLNFFTILLVNGSIFTIPFKNLADVYDTDKFLKTIAANLPKRPPA